MIDKKPPKVSSAEDNDEFEDVASTPHHAFDADVEEENLSDPMAEEDDYEPDAADEGNSAADAARRAKRNGALITYGGGAVFLAIVGFLMWPKYKHYFVAPAPVVVQGAPTPMPESARKPYFTIENSGSGNTDPTTGSGADTSTDAAIPSLSSPSAADSTSTPSGLPSGPTGTPDTTAASPATQPAATPSVPALPAPATGGAPGAISSTATPGGTKAPSLPQASMPAVPPPATAPGESAPVATLPSLSPAPSGVAPSKDTAEMQATIDKMTADQETATAKIGQMQAQIDKLQAQLADLATVQAKPSHKTPTPVHRAPAQVSHHAVASVHWVLRSAVPGMALISHGDSNELQHVAVGDVVTGLGKITSIEEHDGHWVVQGSSGSVSE
jgi:hypothetical protein